MTINHTGVGFYFSTIPGLNKKLDERESNGDYINYDEETVDNDIIITYDDDLGTAIMVPNEHISRLWNETEPKVHTTVLLTKLEIANKITNVLQTTLELTPEHNEGLINTIKEMSPNVIEYIECSHY